MSQQEKSHALNAHVEEVLGSAHCAAHHEAPTGRSIATAGDTVRGNTSAFTADYHHEQDVLGRGH